jgi:hypothetical protein
VIDGIKHEWKRKGGNRLDLSELACLEIEPSVVAYNMFNVGNVRIILLEGKRLMQEAADLQKVQ